MRRSVIVTLLMLALVMGLGAAEVMMEGHPIVTSLPPAAPILVSPASHATLVPVKPTFIWLASPIADIPSGYKLYYDTNNPPQTLQVDTSSLSYTVLSALQPETAYYWRVEAYNDFGSASSAVFMFTTAPEGTVMIGDEENNMQLPIYPYYGYTYSQSIYYGNEILAQYHTDGMTAESLSIEKIAYYWNGNGPGNNSNLWSVYMGHKGNDEFVSSNDWVPASELTEVYSGTVNLSNTEGWVLIELDRPFLYNTLDNLVIAVNEHQHGYDEYGDYFYSTSSQLNRSLSYYTDGQNPSPCDPPNGNRIRGYPNLMLGIGELSDNQLPQIHLPQELSFIRNAPFDVDFSRYITDEDTPYSQVGISVTCAGEQFPLTIEYLGTGEPFTAGQLTVRFSSDVTYAFSKHMTLRVRDYASGYEASAAFTLTQLEEFNAFARTDLYCELTGETVQFYDITRGNPNYWLWDFGDGNTSTLQHPSHVYAYAGTYDVSLTLGHSVAQETDSITYPSMITMAGTAVPAEDIPDTWDIAGSPWNIFAGIVIDDEDEVTIDEGVVVNIITPDPMVIRGRMAATNVTFQSPQEGGGWGGLKFEGSGQRNPSELIGCTFQNAILPLDIQAASPHINQTTITRADLGETALRIVGASGVQIYDLDISGYGNAILISNNGSSSATPTLGNIRVRNSSQTSRSRSWGVKISGNAHIEDMEVEDFDTGIDIVGSEYAATPTLGNIRVRNSSQTSRDSSIGIYLHDLQRVKLEDVEIEGYDTGLWVAASGDYHAVSTPTLGNIRVRNSSQTSRYANIGIYLGPSVKGKLRAALVENAGIGILIDEGNDTVLEPAQIFNCSVGIKAVGTPEPRSLKRHLIVNESMRENGSQYIAFWLVDSSGWKVQNNTIYGYPVYLKAENTDVIFINNIAWGGQQASQPFILQNSQVTATYNDTSTPLAGAGNFQADPLFVYILQRDFHLTHDSPCIDTGSPSLPLDEDETISDVGAYTYLHTSAMRPSQRFVPVGTTVSFSNISMGHDYPYTICEWDLDKDGIIEATSREWSHQFNTPGVYNIRLRMKTGILEDVRDFDGVVVVQEPQLIPPLQLYIQRQGVDIALNWQPVSESIVSEAVNVEYYIVYQSNSPDGWFDYVDYTRDYNTSYVHAGGAHADRRFYFVIGFIGSELELRQYLQQHHRVRYNDMNTPQMRERK
ncbi:MAG: PKD domain-containing protein [Candidatus Cloacimonetes bacterium]|nr:PKD domain-containing protein [Candidatus Cloacimonadota bacterium]